MSPVEISSLHQWLWMTAIVFAAAILLGAVAPDARKGIFSLIQAIAFTAVVVFAAVRPSDPVDGQTGLIVPMMWVPFFVVSWLGLIIGAKLASKA